MSVQVATWTAKREIPMFIRNKRTTSTTWLSNWLLSTGYVVYGSMEVNGALYRQTIIGHMSKCSTSIVRKDLCTLILNTFLVGSNVEMADDVVVSRSLYFFSFFASIRRFPSVSLLAIFLRNSMCAGQVDYIYWPFVNGNFVNHFVISTSNRRALFFWVPSRRAV